MRDTLIQFREHVIADGRVSWVIVSQRIAIHPFDNHMIALKQGLVALNPIKETLINFQMLASVAKHDDSRLRTAISQRNGYDIAELSWRAIVVFHSTRFIKDGMCKSWTSLGSVFIPEPAGALENGDQPQKSDGS